MIKRYNIWPKILTKQFKLIIIDVKWINPVSLNSFIKHITSKDEQHNYWLLSLTMSNLYAAQYQFQYVHKTTTMNDEQFKLSYFPKHWFHSGVMLLDHDDKQPELKTQSQCGSDLTCKLL